MRFISLLITAIFLLYITPVESKTVDRAKLSESRKIVDKKGIALSLVWEMMTSSYKARYGFLPKKTPKRAELIGPNFTNNELPSYRVRATFSDYIAQLEWIELNEMFAGLRTLPEYWRVLLVAALIQQETNFRNVTGKHGEKGPCQIKPATFLWLLAKEHGVVNISQAEVILEQPTKNVRFGNAILVKFGLDSDDNTKATEALMRYNASKCKEAYAKAVLEKYQALKSRFQVRLAKI